LVHQHLDSGVFAIGADAASHLTVAASTQLVNQAPASEFVTPVHRRPPVAAIPAYGRRARSDAAGAKARPRSSVPDRRSLVGAGQALAIIADRVIGLAATSRSWIRRFCRTVIAVQLSYGSTVASSSAIAGLLRAGRLLSIRCRLLRRS